MMLHTSRIADLLCKKPGRYIHHDAGDFRMKEANGEDVKLTEDRRASSRAPQLSQITNIAVSRPTESSRLARAS
jgi:hypothetical protein